MVKAEGLRVGGRASHVGGCMVRGRRDGFVLWTGLEADGGLDGTIAAYTSELQVSFLLSTTSICKTLDLLE